MKHPSALLESLLLLSLLWVAELQAQIYEWVDEAGNRHYSDQKPEGVEYRVVGNPEGKLSSYTAPAIPAPHRARDESEKPSSGASSRVSNSTRASDRRATICDDYLAQIQRINDRLRVGYDEPRGNQLRARRSALRTAYRRDCIG